MIINSIFLGSTSELLNRQQLLPTSIQTIMKLLKDPIINKRITYFDISSSLHAITIENGSLRGIIKHIYIMH